MGVLSEKSAKLRRRYFNTVQVERAGFADSVEITAIPAAQFYPKTAQYCAAGFSALWGIYSGELVPVR
jgi:hypothetical protein